MRRGEKRKKQADLYGNEQAAGESAAGKGEEQP